MNNTLNADSLMMELPAALANDEKLSALARTAAELLAGREAEIESIIIYPCIDQLPEEMLDTLAYDFKIDWWDDTFSLEDKRRTMKESWHIHRLLGTKEAVEVAIRASFGSGVCREWFDYGGEPFHFRVEGISVEATEHIASFLHLLRVVKRQSAVLDHIRLQKQDGIPLYAGIALRVARKEKFEGVPIPDSRQQTVFYADESGLLADEHGTLLVEED